MSVRDLPTKNNLIKLQAFIKQSKQGHKLLEQKKLILTRELDKYKQKEKALKAYLEYTSKVHNDSSVLHIIASIYKSLKDNVNYKKFLDMALTSSYEKVESPIPNSEDLVLGINIGVAAGLSMNDDVKYGVETYKKIMQYSPIPNNILTPYLNLELKKLTNCLTIKNGKKPWLNTKMCLIPQL